MTTETKPGRLLAEGALIVVSILLAFAIDAWWEDSRERADERATLQDLRQEFQQNRTELGRTMGLHREAAGSLQALSEMSDAEVRALPPDRVLRFHIDLVRSNTFDDRIGTLDGLITSGRLGIIRSDEVRSLLGLWKGTVDDLFDDADMLTRASERMFQRQGELGVSFSRELTADDLVVLARDAELLNRWRAKNSVAYVYVNDLQGLDNLAARVLDALEVAISEAE